MEPVVAEVLVVEKEPGETEREGHVEVVVACVEPQAPPAEPERKRRGRAPSEGEPLKRVLIFLGSKEIDALRAQAGGRGVSTRYGTPLEKEARPWGFLHAHGSGRT
jgi:hypothetical protein